MLCAYLCFFGILQLLSQRKDEAGKMKIGFVRSKFAFLHHDFGLGLYLLLYAHAVTHTHTLSSCTVLEVSVSALPAACRLASATFCPSLPGV